MPDYSPHHPASLPPEIILRVIRVGNIRKRSKEADMPRLLSRYRRLAAVFFVLFLAGVGGLEWWG